MNTFEMCRKLIESNRCEKEKMLNNLDLFLLGDRITEEEYNNLRELMGVSYVRESLEKYK